MKVLVLGGHGLVGCELAEQFVLRGIEAIIPPKSSCNIGKVGEANAVVSSVDPDVVVNLAATTNVDDCEEAKSDEAWDTNSYGALAVAMACYRAAKKPYLIHVSTDYVFDGGTMMPYKPADRVHPISVYGRTKAAGESAVLDLAGMSGFKPLVLRTSWVFGRSKSSFPEAILTKILRTNDLVDVCDDQVSVPTRAYDLATWIAEAVADKQPGGIMHFRNLGEPVSRADWAKNIVEGAKMLTNDRRCDPRRINFVKTNDLPLRAARRPAFSALNIDDAMASIPINLSWDSATYVHIEWLRDRGFFT